MYACLPLSLAHTFSLSLAHTFSLPLARTFALSIHSLTHTYRRVNPANAPKIKDNRLHCLVSAIFRHISLFFFPIIYAIFHQDSR